MTEARLDALSEIAREAGALALSRFRGAFEQWEKAPGNPVSEVDLRVGGAQVSELHCNFLINEGGATAAQIEELGETVRARVKATSGIDLDWEIKRIGLDAEQGGA